MIIALCKGFLEPIDSDLAGLERLATQLQALSPAISFKRYQWDDAIDPSADVMIGNSWGGANIFDCLDKNPSTKPKLVVTVDAVKNMFIGQDPGTGWNLTKYSGVGKFIIMREPFSILRGAPVASGISTAVEAKETWPFKVGIYKNLNGVVVTEEWILATRDPGLAFDEHFEILNHPVAMNAIVEAVRALL